MSVELTNESAVAVNDVRIMRTMEFALDQLHVHPNAELAVLLVDEPAMEALHIEYLREPGSTDVMSFPMDELRPGKPGTPTPPGMLGDIVVCPQVAEEQARVARHSLTAEIQLLAVHGLLHLLGYDHGTPEEEARMFGLQRAILEAFRQAERSGIFGTAE